MLTRDQVKNLRNLKMHSKLYRRGAPFLFKLFSVNYISDYLSDMGQEADTEVAEALRYAAAGEQEDVNALLAMLDENPRLLLQAGNVRTRSGLLVKRVTIYEFCLGAGDPELAAEVQKRFANIWDENGVLFSTERAEQERARQYEPYQPHIEKLARQLETGEPTYDLTELFNIIKASTAEDITEALNKNMAHPSALRDALIAFRNTVKHPESKGVGMHFEHYTTLIQAFKLLDTEWDALSQDNTDFDKCRLVTRQIIGYLQRDLPTIDRIRFARAFTDKTRTLNYKDESGSFLDSTVGGQVGLGFDEWIFARPRRPAAAWAARRSVARWKSHVEQKLQACRTYAPTAPTDTHAGLCNFLR